MKHQADTASGGAYNRFCFCHTCNRAINSYGIARHRAMHRSKKEYCEITYSDGKRYGHNFAAAPNEEEKYQ